MQTLGNACHRDITEEKCNPYSRYPSTMALRQNVNGKGSEHFGMDLLDYMAWDFNVNGKESEHFEGVNVGGMDLLDFMALDFDGLSTVF
jgi:hypothetical protein